MKEFIEAFSNREISLLIWSTILIGCIFFINVKSSLSLIKQLFSKHFLPFYLGYGIYFYFIIKILSVNNIWEISLYKDLFFWFVTSGIILFFNIGDLKGIKDFRIIILKLISINVIAEFIVGVYNFSIITELILIPTVSFISILYAFSSHNKEKEGYLVVSKFLNTLLSIIGLGVFIYTIYKFISAYDELFTLLNLKSFLFSPLFTLLFLPLIYLTVVYMKYEILYVDLNRNQFLDDERKSKIRKSILRYGNINLTYLDNARNIILWRKYELAKENEIGKYIKSTIKSKVEYKD